MLHTTTDRSSDEPSPEHVPSAADRAAFLSEVTLETAPEYQGDETVAFGDSIPVLSQLNNWMSGIPDETKVTDISIPGTHESCAVHDDTAFGYGRCQAQSLEWQLNNGIRFIDIRCARRSSQYFEVFHGDINQHLYFGSVLQMCHEFLKARPTETIFMRLSQTKSNASTADFQRTFEDIYLDQDGWRSLFHIENTLPTLGAVRGKIVLATSGPYIGGLNLGSSLFDTQDNWDKPGIDAKASYVRNHLIKAVNAGASKSKMFLNYTSATGVPHTPWGYAQRINPYTLQELARLHDRTKSVGVVLLNYCDRPHNSTSGGYTNMMTAVINMNRIRPWTPQITVPVQSQFTETIPVFSGTGGEPGETITVVKSGEPGTVLGTTTVDRGRKWSVPCNRELPEGRYSINARQSNEYGQSDWGPDRVFHVREQVSPPPRPPEIVEPRHLASVSRRPTFKGTYGEPGAIITVCKRGDPNTVLGETRVTNGDMWSVQCNRDLPINRTYEISVKQSNPGGSSDWVHRIFDVSPL
ncbi:phosphatidylinositol-specific phospholipase C domain-containing protein [Streptomyces halobius]|uniref:1-phosphatidylinositol phosphodiesterase n=1 Tax=Streptomyces halobius TaxID=2879846 RepID=A0ABY4M0L8_9ACTN|nr:phosphatidylinositol-specific phospholipase C domain-containing protein [Streptomyces halobius]UQA91299.1 phosphatidylinositol-specific phospholipase C domain-containing protein [Streptomyces halobius]